MKHLPLLNKIWMILLVFLRVSTTKAALDLGFGTDDDLTNFVTRPDIKVPRFDVAVYDATKLVPGYWFVGPYANVRQESMPGKYYQPCQTGPTIYDQTGELIWSGACMFRNHNSVDFRAWRANGTSYLSTLFWVWKDVDDKKGHAAILNSSFEVVQEVHVPRTMPSINMHEFNVVGNGQRALYLTHRTQIIDFEAHNLDLDTDVGLILDVGFHEYDLLTGEILFEWWASDHISVNETTAEPDDLAGPWPLGWNWIHLNSVDKDSNGDYMVSARYTNAIYKVSGRDGSLIWTLGGVNSSFQLEHNFNFSRQHDARFLSRTDSTEVITFLDNGGDGPYQTSNFSSALIVSLDLESRMASVVKRWIRPGNKQTFARGNFQLLPNGNAFTAWSDNCAISEHTADGELVMEAEFASYRFVTYRTWKFNFTGTPTRLPAVKAFNYGVDAANVTVVYVSWNGATEVAHWNFYGVTNEDEKLIGSATRRGFETMLQVSGFHQNVLAEAIAEDGSVLGRSEVEAVVIAAVQDGNYRGAGKDIVGGANSKVGFQPSPTYLRSEKQEL